MAGRKYFLHTKGSNKMLAFTILFLSTTVVITYLIQIQAYRNSRSPVKEAFFRSVIDPTEIINASVSAT